MLSEEQFEFLEFALPVISKEGAELSDWERSFMADQQSRFIEWQRDMSLSAKQWAVIIRVWTKLDYAMPVGLKVPT